MTMLGSRNLRRTPLGFAIMFVILLLAPSWLRRS